MAIPNLLIEFENFRHTREGFVEIILASQLMDQRPSEWNKPYPLGAFGRDLLQAIYTSQFQLDLALEDAQVYWEFKLGPEIVEGSRWPDLAVRTAQRLILFELKTEDGSIREGQVDEYLVLGRDAFPNIDVDMIYITTNPTAGQPPANPQSLYCNLTWATIASLQRSLRQPAAPDERAILAIVYDYLDRLGGFGKKKSRSKSGASRSATSPMPELAPVFNEQGKIDFDAALQVFHQVESSGQQAGLELACESPNDAYRIIDEIEEQIRISNENSTAPILHARAWVWTPESRGEAMTESGRTHHVEIRVSRHKKAQRAAGA